MTTVDIHCHTFNADDLPIRGFIERVLFDDDDMGRDVGLLLDLAIQGKAPGYVDEKQRLDALLADKPDAVRSLVAATGPPDLEAETDAVLARLLPAEEALLKRIASRLPQAPDESDVRALEAFSAYGFGWIAAARRAVRFARLLRSYRLDNTSRLVEVFGEDQVGLCTPMLVDLEFGLNDKPGTTVRQQMALQEKISRLSMLGRLPGTSSTRVHPFIGFDPRRQVRAAPDVEKPFDVVKLAIESYGFIGVKLYPPMGWRPIGNAEDPPRGMTQREAEKVDEALREFYHWCQTEHVPITAHGNPSNEAHGDYRDFSHPDEWAKVLGEFGDLRLNLGHFGGIDDPAALKSWPRAIAELAEQYKYVFADVGNHHFEESEDLPAYVEALDQIFGSVGSGEMRSRLMFGSDWYMLTLLPDHTLFLRRYRDAYRERMGDEATADFMGNTALRFLGFDQDTMNRQRLRRRYDEWAPPDRLPNWLA